MISSPRLLKIPSLLPHLTEKEEALANNSPTRHPRLCNSSTHPWKSLINCVTVIFLGKFLLALPTNPYYYPLVWLHHESGLHLSNMLIALRPLTSVLFEKKYRLGDDELLQKEEHENSFSDVQLPPKETNNWVAYSYPFEKSFAKERNLPHFVVGYKSCVFICS